MKFFFSFFLVMFSFFVSAQTDSTATALPKRVIIKIPNKPKPKPTLKDTTIVVIDTIQNAELAKQIADSIALAKANDSIALINKKDTTIYKLLEAFPLLNNNKPEFMMTSFKEATTKDALFYLLVGIVLLLALIRIVFPKYLKNVFSIFFQTSFRQKQTKEQLTQDNIAALLLNILFIISISTFITLISDKFKITKTNFWQIFAFAVIALSSIYLTKFLFTQFMAWVFNKTEIAQSYSFVVFIVNKVIGVALIPFLFLLAFSTTSFRQIAFSTAVILIIILFLFRFYSTYKTLSNRLKINAFHFFLYFCSVEILPLLIMYKALTNYIGNGI